MVTAWRDKVVYYKHAFYGSAILVASLLSIFFSVSTWIIYAGILAGIILIGISLVVSWVINKYPKEFEEELGDIREIEKAKKVIKSKKSGTKRSGHDL